MSEPISRVSATSGPESDVRPAAMALWQKVLLALFSGALFYLISPLKIAPLQWIAWVPLMAALEGRRRRQDFFVGWLGGFALNVAGFYWIVPTITVFSNLPLPVALFVLGVFAAYGGLPYGLIFAAAPRLRATLGRASIFLVPSLWVAIELLFPQIFPYHQGDVQYQYLAVTQIASITGIYGVSWLVMASNATVFELWEAFRKRAAWPVLPAAVVAGLIALSTGWGAWRVQQVQAQIDASPKVRLGLIQGNYGVQERRRTSLEDIFARYQRLTAEAVEKGATLIIWGEGASPYSPIRGWKKLEEYNRSLGTSMIVGASGQRLAYGKQRHTNSAYALQRGDTSFARYDKNILLAFGEYLPGSEIFPSWKGKIKGIGDFVPGEGDGLFRFQEPQGEVRALMLICYEAILNGFVYRQSAETNPNLLVNITHDAWFGDTAAPHQFLMLVTSRAVELGVSIARIANTGISCVIDPTGRVRGETPLFQQAVLVEEVSLSRIPTLYTVIGDSFAWLCCLASIVAGVLYGRRRKDLVKGADVAPPSR